MCSKASILHNRNPAETGSVSGKIQSAQRSPAGPKQRRFANSVRNLPCIAVGVCDGRHNIVECERRRCVFWLAILDLARRSASATLAAAAKAQMPSVSSTGRPAAGGQRDSLNDRLWNGRRARLGRLTWLHWAKKAVVAATPSHVAEVPIAEVPNLDC
jgi:hypothetical protein